MGVIAIGVGTCRSAREMFRCTGESRQQARERSGQSLEHMGAPATSLGAPRITVE